MRAFRRNLNYAERTARVEDAELRRAELERFNRRAEEGEINDFINTYEAAYAAVEQLPQFLNSPVGAYFPVPYNVYMASARARLAQTFRNLFAPDGVGGLTPINSAFDWDPHVHVMAYHPPMELRPVLTSDVFRATRDRFV